MSRYLFTITASIFLLGFSISNASEPVVMSLPPGVYAKKLGTNKLKDPSGVTHSREDVKGKVVVAIFTTPHINKGVSYRWSNLLAKNPKTKLPDSVALALVENIAAAGGFGKMGITTVKSEFVKGDRPIPVLDDDGRVFRRFGVADNTTQIYIFDKQGRLRDIERDLSNEALVLKRVRSIVSHLENE